MFFERRVEGQNVFERRVEGQNGIPGLAELGKLLGFLSRVVPIRNMSSDNSVILGCPEIITFYTWNTHVST